MNQFDIIGDVHGHATELRQLLSKLGYQQTQSGYQHPKRTALFVGDFIDRGPAQLEVLDIVRTMIENRSARAVMGNHEFNAIGWFSRNDNGEPLREHTEKNRKQHAAFLNEVGENSAQHKEWISWFKTLPLWLELPELQIIHACWNPQAGNSTVYQCAPATARTTARALLSKRSHCVSGNRIFAERR